MNRYNSHYSTTVPCIAMIARFALDLRPQADKQSVVLTTLAAIVVTLLLSAPTATSKSTLTRWATTTTTTRMRILRREQPQLKKLERKRYESSTPHSCTVIRVSFTGDDTQELSLLMTVGLVVATCSRGTEGLDGGEGAKQEDSDKRNGRMKGTKGTVQRTEEILEHNAQTS